MSGRSSRIVIAAGLALLAACVVKRPKAPEGVRSFRVEVVSVDPFTKPSGCEDASDLGSARCPRPFATPESPLRLRLRATALDAQGNPMTDWVGMAQLDARPGRFADVGAGGLSARFTAGVAEVDVGLYHAYGPTRLWVEDCGSSADPGTFATGVTPEIWFEQPRVHELNATTDNTTSPLVPRFSNVCAIGGDPRFGLGVNENGEVDYVGYSHGRKVNAPPPAMGNYVELSGCDGAAHDTAVASGTSCARGPLIVTGVGNEGFYFTDLHPDAMANGFNHMYAFNFNYPDDLQVGDLLLWVRGSPVEFAGSTQLSNPTWKRDPRGRRLELLPKPVKIDPAAYQAALRTYGRNREELLDLEKLEGAIVCMDNLAPAAMMRDCDVNASGNIERQGCLTDMAAPMPPRCEDGRAPTAQPPNCDAESAVDYCMPLTADELAACELKGYVPANAAEYCCERLCYNDFACTETSSLVAYGQWTAEVFGRYEAGSADTPPVKIAVISRDAQPELRCQLHGEALDAEGKEPMRKDPLDWSACERYKPDAERRRLRVIGSLRQVLAARPVWVIIAHSPTDLEVGGTCPTP